MRILFASYFYPPSIGGVERQSDLLVRGLRDRGHSVHVISARRPGVPDFERDNGIVIERVPSGSGSRWQKMATYVAGMVRSAAKARAQIDLIHVQQALYPAAAMGLAAVAFRRPLVVANHGSGQFGAVSMMSGLPLGSFALGLIARTAAVCVSLSDAMDEEMRQAGIPRIVQIPNGVSVPPATTASTRRAARQALGLDDGSRVALYLGRLDHEKGVDVLIRAWHEVSTTAQGLKLLIVGDGPKRGALAQLASEQLLPRSGIQFSGPATDVRPFLEAADLFVLPSRAEGLSVALLEAMASGLPIVATSVGGSSQVIQQRRTGLLVPPEDAHALARAILELEQAREFSASLGRAARAQVVEHYSVDRMVDCYEQLYRRACGGESHGPARGFRFEGSANAA